MTTGEKKKRYLVQFNANEIELLRDYSSVYLVEPAAGMRIAASRTLAADKKGILKITDKDTPPSVNRREYEQVSVSLPLDKWQLIEDFREKYSIRNINTAWRIAFLKGVEIDKQNGIYE